MVNMVKKRGPKYPSGIAKRKILLIALNYPNDIGEAKLTNEINDLLYKSKANRGIKGHLDDLGPGRTVKGKWREGKQYLIKIPSKYEPKKMKGKLIPILKNQGVEIDIDNLPEENIWKPNPDLEIFKKIAEELLVKDTAASFIQTKYTQKMLKEHGFPFVEHVYNVDLSKKTEATELLKEMLLKYPAPLLLLLLYHPEKAEIEGGLNDSKKFQAFAPMIYTPFLPLFQYLLDKIDDEILIANYYLSMNALTKFVRLYPESILPSADDLEKLLEINRKTLEKALTPEVLENMTKLLAQIQVGFEKIAKKREG